MGATTSAAPDPQRLSAERVAWICTLRADGSPHQTPVWFCFEGDAWWISSASRNVKVRNVLADARVSIALPDGEHPVVAEGVAEVLLSPVPAEVRAAFAAKYGGWDIADESSEGPRLLIRVVVQRWLMTGRAR